MIIKNISHIIVVCSLISGCASTIKYKPESSQYKLGEEILYSEIPKSKSVLEFTTNTVINATLAMHNGADPCKPDKLENLSRVQRQIESSELNDFAIGLVNVLTLGMVKKLGDPRDNKTPVSHYIYLESGKDTTLQSSSYSLNQTAGGWVSSSCGPIFMKFTPEQGRRYKISFNTTDGGCFSTLTQLENGIEIFPRHSRWSCTKPTMGVGGNQVIGFKEIAGGQP
jgi:hypothetical protein